MDVTAKFGSLDRSEVRAKLSGVLDRLMTISWLLFEGATGLLVGLEAGDIEVVVVVVVGELVVVVVVFPLWL